MRDDEAPEIVTASEIGSWGWCPEAWRLNALGAEPTNPRALRRGAAKHVEMARVEHGSRLVIALGSWLLAVGSLLLLGSLLGLLS